MSITGQALCLSVLWRLVISTNIILNVDEMSIQHRDESWDQAKAEIQQAYVLVLEVAP